MSNLKRFGCGSAAAGVEHSGECTAAARAGRHRPATVYAPFYEPYYWNVRPDWAYPYAVGSGYGDVRTQITPKQAEVYVDGFYAGTAGDFDGVFKRLHLMPGGHAITVYLPGYRTITQDVYVRPDSTVKMRDTMERLESGQASAPPPEPMWQRVPRQNRG